jgi:hypothetical protein
MVESFSAAKPDNFIGVEFKENFLLAPTMIVGFSISFNSLLLGGVTVQAVAKKWDGTTSRILLEATADRFYNYGGVPIFLGADEYFGIVTTHMENGNPPGGVATVLARIA